METSYTNMKKRKPVQQGDLLIIPIHQMPEGVCSVVSKKRCVLAHGESGHSHVIEDDDAQLIQIGERMLLRLENPQYSGPLKKCVMKSQDENQFICDTHLGLVAFSKTNATFRRGTVNIASFGLIRHQEHIAHAIEPGIWEIGRVKEYDYLSQMTRQVMD